MYSRELRRLHICAAYTCHSSWGVERPYWVSRALVRHPYRYPDRVTVRY